MDLASEPGRGKDMAAALPGEITQLPDIEASAEAERKGAARGRSDDQVEAIRDGLPIGESLLQPRQDRGGKDPSDAAAIIRKDAKVPVL